MAVLVDDEEVANFGLPSLLHELAEGLHSTGNYLRALRRAAPNDAHEWTSNLEIIEKALDELGRSTAAFHILRRRLCDADDNAVEKPAIATN